MVPWPRGRALPKACCAAISAERLGHPTKTASTLGLPAPRAVMLRSILYAHCTTFTIREIKTGMLCQRTGPVD